MTQQITKIDALKGRMGTQEYTKQITNYYRGDKDGAMMFLTACIEYVRKVPKLLQCDQMSLMTAFMQSAQFRFMPSGVMGESYIIPYGTEAKFQLGYQGIVTLLWRTEKLRAIKAIVVHDNEHFRYEEGLETRLEHTPTKFGEKKGKPIGVYAVAETTNGGRLFKVMSEDDVMAIKDMSKAKDKKDSPWNSKDPERWMWKKTCLIQLAKLLPKTQELRQAIEKDYEGEGLEKRDRAAEVNLVDDKSLTMGAFAQNKNGDKDKKKEANTAAGTKNAAAESEGNESA